jgi:hypothetical protein
MDAMIGRVWITASVLLALMTGCRADNATRPESAAARALCDREVGTTDPPGSRGVLVGAFDTTVRAVGAEHRRLYRRDLPGDGLADRRGDEQLALCYYDVPAEQTAVSPPGLLGPIERVSVVVDSQLNSYGLHGGPKSAVPVEGIGP